MGALKKELKMKREIEFFFASSYRISVAKMVFDGKAWSPNGEDWVHKE